MSALAIEADGVGKLYEVANRTGRGSAPPIGLRGLDLAVEPGHVLALLGPNGAGKTTAVRGLSTLLRFDRGTARIAGFDVDHEPDQVRERIGLVGQAAAVDDQLTGHRNLVLFARLRGLHRKAARQRADALIEEFGLADAAHRSVGTYSGGMRRRLDLAASLVVPPPVLFVDEPTTGLDPGARRDLWRSLSAHVHAGAAVLLTTQYLEEADALADEIVMLHHGDVVARGSADQLKATLGGSTLLVRFDDPADTDAALPVLRALDPASQPGPGGDTTTTIIVPVSTRETLPRCVHTLATAGLVPTELAQQRPSLDDVFLALTADPTPSQEIA